MKVYTIEVVEAIENEMKKFLSEWGGGYSMRFTRFLDLGGQQCDLYAYPAEAGSAPWLVVRVKSVFKSDQGDCMQYFVNLPSVGKNLDDVLVSPEIWKLPALADKILQFIKNDLLIKINEGGGTLEGGGEPSLEAATPSLPQTPPEEDEDDLEDLDTSGILAGDDDSGGGSDDDFDPSDLLASLQEESDKEGDGEDDDGSSGFNPEDVIKD